MNTYCTVILFEPRMRVLLVLHVLLLLVYLCDVCGCLKIIQFVPGFSNSHILFNYRLADILTSQGHNVTLWTAIVSDMVNPELKIPPGTTEIKFNVSTSEGGMRAFQKIAFKKYTLWDMIRVGQLFRKTWGDSCEQQLEQVSDFIRRADGPEFDVAIMHYLDVCPVALVHILGIRKQVWLSAGIYIFDFPASSMGLPQNPSYIPNAMSAFSDRMSFIERVRNFLTYAMITLYLNYTSNLNTDENEAFRSPPNEDRPSVFDLTAVIQGLFINGDQLLDFPRPLPFGVTFTGEMRREGKSKGQTELNENWLNLLDSAHRGIVIFSLGTVANTSEMPTEIREAFAEGFKSFPNHIFVWRIEGEVPGIEDARNIHLFKWIPQRDLLRHPKTKVFITHGGYNSLLETTEAGIPVIVMPLFGDQFCNAMRAVRHGMGVMLDKHTVSSSDVVSALGRVLNEQQFQQNARRFSKLLKDLIMDPETLVSRRLEFLQKSKWYPTLHAAKNLHIFQYLCVDVILFLLVCGVLSFHTL